MPRLAHSSPVSRLLGVEQVPGPQQSPAITSGYRRRLGYGDCFRSVFSLHNETVNIWTHLLGFLCFLVLMVKDLAWAQEHIRDIADYGATALQLLTYQVCMLASSLFHTLSCHESGPRWLSLDQASILLALYATYAKFLLTQLSCWPHHQVTRAVNKHFREVSRCLLGPSLS